MKPCGPDTLQPEKGAAPQLRLRVVRSLRPTADREAEPVAQRAHRSRDAREVRGSSPEFARETGAAATDGSDPQPSGAGTAIFATVSAWKPGVGAETGDGHRPFPLCGTRTTGSRYRESDCGLRSTAKGRVFSFNWHTQSLWYRFLATSLRIQKVKTEHCDA
jgi:hypothetical protein